MRYVWMYEVIGECMNEWMNPDFLYDFFFRIYEFVNDTVW